MTSVSTSTLISSTLNHVPDTTPPSRYKIIFDIDGVLCFHKANSFHLASFLEKYGLVIKAIVTFYLFPGIKEFIQLLQRTDDIDLGFYSSGSEERNNKLIKKLFIATFSKEIYSPLLEKIQIISKKYTTTTEDAENKLKLYGLDSFGGYKNLSAFFSEFPENIEEQKEVLQNHVLIEDQSQVIALNQVENLLFVPRTESDHYSISQKCVVPHTNKNLMCLSIKFSTVKPNEFDIKEIEKKKYIGLFRVENVYQLKYFDQEEMKLATYNISSGQPLFNALETLSETAIQTDCSRFTIQDEFLINNLIQLVESLNGKATKVWRSVNRIYYVVGLLFTALKEAREKNKSLSSVLFGMQFEKKGNHYQNNFAKLYKDDRYYLLGLEKLQEINPNLKLLTPYDYLESKSQNFSEEDRARISKYMDEEDDGCVIM
ncbi:MAG: hypothetical protein BGO10_03170 [Chlamydia sp. 32-24]|nr:MAG: hypothetical protein BGO10_03170 [Chlamydia sp. 32-24]